jgi:hypothetical protein
MVKKKGAVKSQTKTLGDGSDLVSNALTLHKKLEEQIRLVRRSIYQAMPTEYIDRLDNDEFETETNAGQNTQADIVASADPQRIRPLIRWNQKASESE